MSGKRKAAEANLDGATDWSAFTVADLKAELEQRGLPKNGKKIDLVRRLKDDDGEAPVAQVEASSSRTDAKRYVIHIGTARARPRAHCPPRYKSYPKFLSLKSGLIRSHCFALSNPMMLISFSTNSLSQLAPAKKAATKATKTGYSAQSASKLKEECTARGISTGGNKTDLVERLEDDDAEKSILADPNYVPRRDEVAIATGEKRLKVFQPRPDSDFKERYKKAVSLNFELVPKAVQNF